MNEANNPGGTVNVNPNQAQDFDNADDWGATDEKVTRGNRGMIIAFLLILAAGGALGAFWYKNNAEEKKWEQKLKAAMALPDGEFEAAMRSILEEASNTEILAQAALELGEARDVKSVDLLSKAVSKGGKVGLEAARALAMIGGKDAKIGIEPIFAAMQQAQELDKAKYAWALCELGDARGFGPLLEAVGRRVVTTKSLPGFDREIFVRIATTDKLIEMASSDDAMLRMYAATELGFRDDGEVVPPLLKLVKDSKDAVAEAAAISLGRTTDDRAGSALMDMMERKPGIRDSILSTIAQSVGSPGLESIYKNMTQADDKYKIVGKLKQLRDPRSKDLLFSIASEKFEGSDKKSVKQGDEIRNQSLWTLEDLGDPRIAPMMFEKTQWEPATEEQIPDEAVRYRQDDMARKIANGVVSWFGKVKPEGVSDYLLKIYDANKPYSNSPECAKRVKVDIDPLMDAMGRSGDQQFCALVRPFLDQDEGFSFQAAAMAMGRLKCPGGAKDLIKRMQMTAKERKEEKFASLLESRDWQMENRLQERRNSIIALKFYGSPEAGDKLMTIVLDAKDDQELRREAASSLAFCADDDVMDKIVEKVRDEDLDIVARAALIQGLWLNPSEKATNSMLEILEGQGHYELIKPAAIVVGEAANPANNERLQQLLEHADENRQRAAVFAILLGGDLKPVFKKVLAIMQGQETKLVIKDWYEHHPVFLDKKMMDSKRIFIRLANAKLLSDKTANTGDEVTWPWRHLVDRLKKGWDEGPNGLTVLAIRESLAEAVRSDPEYANLAAETLSSLNERGYLLTLQAEKGPQAMIARDMLHSMNVGSH